MNRVMIGAGALVLALMAEAVTASVVSVPTYQVSDEVGFIQRPNTSGRFGEARWVFNELSQGVSRPFAPSDARDIALLGDSVVYGGMRLDQGRRLGPVLERKTGWAVWPSAAGGWALANELAYLRRNPEIVAGVDDLVFVVNSADFVHPTRFCSDLLTPRKPPFLTLSYFAVRGAAFKLAPPECERPDGQPPELVEAWREMVSAGKPVTVVLYPNAAEFADPARRRTAFAPAEQLKGDGVRFVDVADDQRWSASFYKDDIHPDEAGTRVLAEVIRDAL